MCLKTYTCLFPTSETMKKNLPVSRQLVAWRRLLSADGVRKRSVLPGSASEQATFWAWLARLRLMGVCSGSGGTECAPVLQK